MKKNTPREKRMNDPSKRAVVQKCRPLLRLCCLDLGARRTSKQEANGDAYDDKAKDPRSFPVGRNVVDDA